MSKNLEIESKTLLNKETYEKMRAAFTAKSDFIQKNPRSEKSERGKKSFLIQNYLASLIAA